MFLVSFCDTKILACYFFRRAIPHSHHVAHLQQVRDNSTAHQAESEEAYPVTERESERETATALKKNKT